MSTIRISLLFFVSICLFISCKNQSSEKVETEKSEIVKDPISYPSELIKIFDAHGSLDKWKEMKSLSYEIVRESGNEKQVVDLVTRNERIETSTFKTGYDGKQYWLEADTSYKGNPKFYHNLMFYFYAMPFVLADEGIIFSETDPLVFEDISYPGIRISYNQGVGESPEDEYFIHYNPTTFKMEWLGYTVTFFSGKKSEKVKWIRYNDWKLNSQLLLPQSITWYNMEEGKITDPRDPTEFTKIELSRDQPDAQIFEKTPKAEIIES